MRRSHLYNLCILLAVYLAFGTGCARVPEVPEVPEAPSVLEEIEEPRVGEHMEERKRNSEKTSQEIAKYRGKDGAPMMLIPAGEFQMGNAFDEGPDSERPVHTVYLDAFYIDKYEVTNARYAKFLSEHGKNTDAAGRELLDIDSCLIERVGNTYRPKDGYEDHPVVEVSWYGAAAYAHFYGKRLPTEAEWEKAARGGLVGKRYPWGDEITHDDANYWTTGGRDIWGRTSPVGSFAANGYGLHDMAGNVWEWCQDWHGFRYYSRSPRENPTGPSAGVFRVLRGGDWYGTPDILRVAQRHGSEPRTTDEVVGFRCVGPATP